jgi:glycosyltransferase involved in cell wall biosynthesis
MKVCVSVHGRFHAFELAAGLHRRGALAGLLTTYPGFAVERLVGARLPTTAAWWLEMRRRLPGLSMPDVELSRAFANFAADHIPETTELLVGWSSATLEAIAPAHGRGMKVIIERGSSHIAHQTEILSEAYAAHGLQISETSVAMIEREVAEYDAADAIAVPSAFAARTFMARGVPEAKLLINPYGVDLRRFTPRQRAHPDRPVRILFVGRVGIRKGIPGLLEAFAPLAGDAELHLIGPVEPAMQSILATAPMQNVSVRGAVPAAALPDEYAKADIFCLPSLEEGFPLVLLQAMASGLPVVTTPPSGAGDILSEGQEGHVVEAGETMALTEVLAGLCGDAEQRQRLGAAARARVESGWGWDDYVARALALYEKFLG